MYKILRQQIGTVNFCSEGIYPVDVQSKEYSDQQINAPLMSTEMFVFTIERGMCLCATQHNHADKTVLMVPHVGWIRFPCGLNLDKMRTKAKNHVR